MDGSNGFVHSRANTVASRPAAPAAAAADAVLLALPPRLLVPHRDAQGHAAEVKRLANLAGQEAARGNGQGGAAAHKGHKGGRPRLDLRSSRKRVGGCEVGDWMERDRCQRASSEDWEHLQLAVCVSGLCMHSLACEMYDTRFSSLPPPTLYSDAFCSRRQRAAGSGYIQLAPASSAICMHNAQRQQPTAPAHLLHPSVELRGRHALVPALVQREGRGQQLLGAPAGQR